MLRWFRRDKKKKLETEEQPPAPQIIQPPQPLLAVPDLDDFDDSELDFIYEDEFGRILVPEDDEAFLSEAEASWEEPVAALLKAEKPLYIPRPVMPPPEKAAVVPPDEKPSPRETGEEAAPASAASAEPAAPDLGPPAAAVPPVIHDVIPPETVEPVPPPEAPVPEDVPAEPIEALTDEAPIEGAVEAEAEEEEPEQKRKGLLARFKERLSNTRAVLTTRVDHLLLGVKEIDEDVLEELEEILILADMGVKTTTQILQTISTQVARNELSSADKLKDSLRHEMQQMLQVPPPEFNHKEGPHVIMVVGVNGVGKTTTIAKLGHRFIKEGKKVMMVAGDTFRAAAVEQLTIWSEKVGADIVKQSTGADPSAVVFDALQAAQARDMDVVIIDTAGRLHTKVNLMEELKKIKRVAGKSMPGAPHEVLLVLDANTGQNAVNQAKLFHETVNVDHLAMTKLDGTAKGGVVVAIYNELKLPIRYVGLGEKMEDLRDFDPDAFVEALFG